MLSNEMNEYKQFKMIYNMIRDRATKSIKFKPCRLNLVMRVWRVEFGTGISLFDPLKLAVVESLLPSKTSHPSPPL